VELEHKLAAERVCQLGGRLDQFRLLGKGQNGDLERGEPWGQVEDYPPLPFDLFLVIGVHEEGEHRTGGTGRRFDHLGIAPLFPLLPEAEKTAATTPSASASSRDGIASAPFFGVPPIRKGAPEIDRS